MKGGLSGKRLSQLQCNCSQDSVAAGTFLLQALNRTPFGQYVKQRELAVEAFPDKVRRGLTRTGYRPRLTEVWVSGRFYGKTRECVPCLVLVQGRRALGVAPT